VERSHIDKKELVEQELEPLGVQFGEVEELHLLQDQEIIQKK
jgi:hypothetical protein